MWTNPSLDDLKNQLIKAKTYKAKVQDIPNFISAFDRYFNHFRNVANPSIVIQIYIQLFIATLHLPPNEKMAECFKRLINWLNQDPNCKSAYLIVKNVVEICEKQFPQAKIKVQQVVASEREERIFKKEEKQKKQKQRGSSQSREKSMERQPVQKQENQSIQSLRANLKAVLNLVRKSGDKNMLIEDPYKAFIEYYLDRISKKIQQNISSKQPKSLKLNMPILSQLSNIMSNRNKTQVVPIVAHHLQQATRNNSSSFILVYLLLELKNIPHLLMPALRCKGEGYYTNSQTISKSWTQYCDDEANISGQTLPQLSQIMASIISELISVMNYCLKNESFDIIPQLYKLFPYKIYNSQQMIDRILIHFSLHYQQLNLELSPIRSWIEWKSHYMQYHQSMIQSTSLQSYRLKYLSGHKNASNILNFGYVVKLYIFSYFFHFNQGLTRHETLLQDVEEFLAILKKQFRNNGDGIIQQYRKLATDCIASFKKLQFLQKNVQSNNALKLRSDFSIVQKDLQKVQIFKSLIYELAQNMGNRQTKATISNKIRKILIQNQENHIIPAWKSFIQSLFQISICKQAKLDNQFDENFQKLHNKQAQIILTLLSIRPSQLPKPNTHTQLFHKLSILEKACVEGLSLVVPTVDKQQLVAFIKRLMSDTFDRVDQQIIRDKISKNIFLCKCLLMTNHIPKCKLLLQFLLRSSQFPASLQPSPQFTSYLSQIFPSVPEQIITEYCRYLATRDKLQFRMALYDKQLTSLQYLIQASVYEQVSCCLGNKDNQ